MVQENVSDSTRQEQSGIPELTKFQYLILRRVATSRASVGVYAALTGVASDRNRERIDGDYRAVATLADLGLLADVSAYPKYANFIKAYKDEEGRTVTMYELTPVGKMMFQRTGDVWLNQIN